MANTKKTFHGKMYRISHFAPYKITEVQVENKTAHIVRFKDANGNLKMENITGQNHSYHDSPEQAMQHLINILQTEYNRLDLRLDVLEFDLKILAYELSKVKKHD